MSNHIPPQKIIHDHILTRLPVKSLLRFRCVCKPWLFVIDSHDFIKSHLKHSISTKSNTVIYTRDDNDFHAYTIKCVPVNKSTAVDFNNLRIYSNKEYWGGKLVGSINGIVCYSWCHNDDASVGGISADVTLWNPSIRKLIMLPSVFRKKKSSQLARMHDALPSFGFGYDPDTDDYKVFRLELIMKVNAYNQLDANLSWDIKVFSFKSMEWTQKKKFPLNLCCNTQKPGCFVNGFLHWILFPVISPNEKPHVRDYSILAFNVGSEKHQLLSLPDFASLAKRYKKEISGAILEALEGFLCLVCDYDSHYMDIWIMKEYGKKESWVRFVSLDQCQYVRPLAYSIDGRKVLLDKNQEQLVWYDLESNNVKKTRIRGTPKFLKDCMLYVESLVQLSSSSNVKLKDDKKIKKKKTKKRIGG